ncbi:sugar ABC transporter substrate-binding protein [Streptomyces sp. GbtcB7]|uniref:ABC transporter substrate-binding protein n=1 Tax=Streptomyces sp. GbtcB7 TaxID=2824752 RepID=UPI0027E58CD2|nr:sugar ABC transporter substrate-binding protein [Streptomyces sp. GbtcB7]
MANPQMQDLKKLAPEFEKSHPGIKLEFSVLPENQLRDSVTKDIATKSGQYDVASIDNLNGSIFAKKGWLTDLGPLADKTSGYDTADFIPSMWSLNQQSGMQYGIPFYGESTFLMYRKDLFAQAGLTMPAHPTWDQIATLADKLNNPSKGVAGICLRGKPGWGEGMGVLSTVIQTFGGSVYDSDWKAQMNSAATTKAVKFYTDLVKKDGEAGAANSGFTECLSTMGQGKAAMWYDSTVGASLLADPKQSSVAGKIGLAPAPVVETKSAGWLSSWSFIIPKTSKNTDAAWQFVSWATSKQYGKLVGGKLGWTRVPPGVRTSTYAIPQYQSAAKDYADATLTQMKSVNPKQPGVAPQPWVGTNYVAIPEYPDLGTKISQEISAVIAGRESVSVALDKAQDWATDVAKSGGYQK